MKINIYTSLKRLLVFSLVFGLSQCKKQGVDASSAILTDANEISKVMVIPGATLEQGTPPAVTNTAGTPILSTSTPEVSAISGQDGTFSVDYSNAVGNITVIYIQIVGADSYFKIPISSNSGTSGRISIPMKMPSSTIVPDGVITPYPSGKSMTTFCCFAATSKGTCSKLCNNRFSSNLPPPAGTGTAKIGNSSYTATAVCDLDFAPFGRGYGIMIGQTQAIVLYNMKTGSNQLGNFEALSSNGNTPTTPFALYFDGTTAYWSVSGTANTNGKTVSASVVLKELFGSRQISVSATGNCQ